jgi:hypothetical protein
MHAWMLRNVGEGRGVWFEKSNDDAIRCSSGIQKKSFDTNLSACYSQHTNISHHQIVDCTGNTLFEWSHPFIDVEQIRPMKRERIS